MNGSGRASKSKSIYTQVAPGLEVSFLIKFSPDAKIDYSYDLKIITEREKFVVPIVATGRKALLNFPDIIDFGNDCPVKYITEKPGGSSTIIHFCLLLNNF